MNRHFTIAAVAGAILAGWCTRAASPSEIYAAIRTGERAPVEKLLTENVSVEDRDEHGNTLLIRAAMYGGPELLRSLIDRGADVNAANRAGATPLMRAAGNGGNIKLLIERGADVNARSALGNTPLILAARANPSAKAVKLLIEHGALVNATNNFGASAIMTAAASGDLDAVRVLLAHGADPNAHSRASDAAVLWGGGRSPLAWAAFRGDLPMIKVLLKAGANPNEVEGFGTALIQTAWADRVDAALLLLKNGSDVNGKDFRTGYTTLHWAASSEGDGNDFVALLLEHGADVNSEGGQNVDAFLDIPQTPLMLANKRGRTEVATLLAARHAKANRSTEKPLLRGNREIPVCDTTTLRAALNASIPPLEKTALESRNAFLVHASKQDCVSCHQQYLPFSATGFARRAGGLVSDPDETKILAMINKNNASMEELTAEATFHPEPGHSYGYDLFALGIQERPADPQIDAIVHHLLVIQGKDGPWYNNLPRPPIQTSDIAPTALAIKALRTYGLPARQKEIDRRIVRARRWLSRQSAANTEELTYQVMGLAWAGESQKKVEALTTQLLKEQRRDGGWSQLATLESDAYATGQALFALHVAGVNAASLEYREGLKYLLRTQLNDGTWHVARRAFPFQPTMRSGYPHSRDSWISAAGASWAVMAISTALEASAPLHVTSAR